MSHATSPVCVRACVCVRVPRVASASPPLAPQVQDIVDKSFKGVDSPPARNSKVHFLERVLPEEAAVTPDISVSGGARVSCPCVPPPVLCQLPTRPSRLATPVPAGPVQGGWSRLADGRDG